MIKVLEYTWLFMALLGLSGIAYKVMQHEDYTEIGFFIFFTFIAAIMYAYRRRQRLTIDRTKAEDTSDKYH